MYTYKADLIRVIDGDTFDFLVELGFNIQTKIRVRLLGLNTPEIRGPDRDFGLRIKAVAEEWFLESDGICTIETKKTGKYGRWLATIYRETKDGPNCLHWVLSDRMRSITDGKEEELP